VFGKETLDQLMRWPGAEPGTCGLPQPPPWRGKKRKTHAESRRTPALLRRDALHGFVSKPEIQKLNRNSIYVFVNGRLIRDRLVQHGLTEAYRNIIRRRCIRWCCFFWNCPRRGGCECASLEDGSALPAIDGAA